MLLEPNALNRCLNQEPPKPWVNRASASGPCFLRTSSMPVATLSRAASQETSWKTSSPRFLARIRGFLSRSGS